MNLQSGILRPGTVVETLYGGCIKAAAPGLFSMMDDPDNLPPIMPWFVGNNKGAYSQPKKHDNVWILNFNDNPLQLYWFRREDYDNVTANINGGGYNVEVLCNCEGSDGEWAGLYFTDNSGWIMSKGDSKIIITPTGRIVLYHGESGNCIEVNKEYISLGSPQQSAHYAAYGDVLEELLITLTTLLNGIAVKALANPHTAAIGTELLKSLPTIVNMIPEITSTKVTID